MDRSSLKINRACHQPWPGPWPTGATALFPLLMITVKMMDIFERNSTTFSLIRTAEHATSNQHRPPGAQILFPLLLLSGGSHCLATDIDQDEEG